MERCEEYLELISAAVDGQLSSQARQTLNRHLAQCPHCRALYAAMAENSAALNAVGESEPPEGFARAVMERVKAEPRARVIPLFRSPRAKKLLTCAACALLCVGVVRFAAGSLRMGSAAPSSTGAAAPSAGESENSGVDSYGLYTAGSSETGGGEKVMKNGGAADGAEADADIPSATDHRAEMTAGAAPDSAGETQLPLTNAARYRVTWSEEVTPGVYLLCSRAELDDLLTQLDTVGLAELLSRYDQAWFDGGRQLASVVVTESSGSVYHEITGLTLMGDQAQIALLRRVPEMGTCDMAAWLLTAETAGAEELSPAAVWYEEKN